VEVFFGDQAGHHTERVRAAIPQCSQHKFRETRRHGHRLTGWRCASAAMDAHGPPARRCAWCCRNPMRAVRRVSSLNKTCQVSEEIREGTPARRPHRSSPPFPNLRLAPLRGCYALSVRSSQLWGMTTSRKAYPSDVSDEEWALVAPYLTLLREDAPPTRLPPSRGVQRPASVLHGSGGGRHAPDPVLGSCDADGLRASQLQHAVQDHDGDVHLGGLTLVRARAQPVPDHALVAPDGGRGAGPPIIP